MSSTILQQQYLPQALPQPIDSAAGTSQAAPVGQAVAPPVAQAAAPALTAAGQAQLSAQQAAGAAPLPDVVGSGGTSSAARASASSTTAQWLQMKPFHLDATLGMVAGITEDNAIQQGQMRRSAFANQANAQLASANEQVKEVQGERESAVTQFVGAVGTAALTAVAGAAGPIGQALAPAVTQVGQSFTTLIDTEAGGKYQADNAKIAKAYLDQLTSVYKAQDDDLDKSQQSAMQALQNVQVDTRKQIYDSNNSTWRSVNSNM